VWVQVPPAPPLHIMYLTIGLNIELLDVADLGNCPKEYKRLLEIGDDEITLIVKYRRRKAL